MSTKTIVAPLCTNASAVETNVYEGIITSSPGLISANIAAISNACVQEVVNKTLLALNFSSIQILQLFVKRPSPQIF